MPAPPNGALPDAPVVVVLKFITPAETSLTNLSNNSLLSEINPAERPKAVLFASSIASLNEST